MLFRFYWIFRQQLRHLVLFFGSISLSFFILQFTKKTCYFYSSFLFYLLMFLCFYLFLCFSLCSVSVFFSFMFVFNLNFSILFSVPLFCSPTLYSLSSFLVILFIGIYCLYSSTIFNLTKRILLVKHISITIRADLIH